MADKGYQKALLRFIALFNAAINSFRFYSLVHPRTRQCLEETYRVLTDLFRLNERITLVVIEDEMIADNIPLKSREAHLGKFIANLKGLGIERLTLCNGLPEEELTAFISQCAHSDAGAIRGSANIKIGRVDLVVEGANEPPEPLPSDQGVVREERQSATDNARIVLADLLSVLPDIKQRRSIDFDRLSGMMESFAREPWGRAPLTLLTGAKSVDDHIAEHMFNVGSVAVSLAASLGFTGKTLREIGAASLLSDVGKLFVPQEIINKPAELTPQERKIIESHVVLGVRYILGLKKIPPLAVLCALEHHRRYGGGGYPALPKKWAPGIVSQIVAIADAYAAMRCRRPYRALRSQETIVSILQEESGASYNPILVKRFISQVLAGDGAGESLITPS